jgi:large subunit ribosomal protein L10
MAGLSSPTAKKGALERYASVCQAEAFSLASAATSCMVGFKSVSGGVTMANAKVLQEKQQIVADVTAKLRESSCTVVADYRGLNVAQVTELRKQLREAGVEFQVLKNTLVRRATAAAELTELDSVLTGPTAVAFSKTDVVAAAKILTEFAKKNEALQVKGGVVEGRVVDVSQIKALAELPSREGLLSMLLSVLQAPIRNFALAVKAVAEKQEGGAQA